MDDVLSITHTIKEGTLLDGTSPRDAACDILKANGWRWGRSIELWYIPRSRENLPKRDLIERTAQALREAGYVVEVSIDTHLDDVAELDQQRRERAAQRAEHLTAKAAAAQQASDRHWDAERKITSSIPLGQPILVGHHSEGRHRRDQARIASHTEKAVQANEAAKVYAERAASARATAQPLSKVSLGNRIELLTGEVRKLERSLQQVDPQRAGSLRGRLDFERAKLEHSQAEWDQRVAAGEFVAYGPDTVRPGDLVKISGLWCRVAKANKKTVSVHTGYSWTDRAPWHKVTDHKPGAQ